MSYIYERRFISRAIYGRTELQRQLNRFAADKWDLVVVLPAGFRRFTIIMTKRVKVKVKKGKI